jgi:hypothetical protein
MKLARIVLPAVLLTASSTALAQKWEVGGAGGYGFYTKKTVTAGSATGETGFENGFAASAWLGNDMHQHIGGEFRYDYRQGDLMVSSGGTKATFGGEAHAIHYDLLIHATSRESKVRPFAAIGAGIKVYRGTGKTQVFQPNSNLVLLSPVTETKGMGSVGGGVKFHLSNSIVFRVEVRDYITAIPKQVLAPSLGAKFSGVIHDIVPTFGIAAMF